jgi:TPP-dependent pyruvate/acetoin dehydrogenase alpha subunit
MTDTAAAPTTELDRELRLRMYRTMVECRLFEQRTHELFLAGLVRGTTHLGIGQEAVAAGFAAAMRDDDWTFCTTPSPAACRWSRCCSSWSANRAR